MPRALSAAFLGCSGSSSGAFQKARMASPMNLSIVALRAISRSHIGVRKAIRKRMICWGVMPSEMREKPRMSQKSTVISRS